MKIEETDIPEQTFLAIKKTATFTELENEELYMQLMNDLFVYATLQAIEVLGQPVGMYFTWNEDTQISDMAIGIPVSNDIASVEPNEDHIEVVRIPGSDAVLGEHYGPYTALRESHGAMKAYCKEHDKHIGNGGVLCYEQYITDPATEPDQGKWLTKVYYLVK